MSYQQNLDWLFQRHRFGMTRTLDTTRKLLAYFGDPHLAIPVIHVTGTNGKGSTCAMIAAIAQEAGYKVGLYTSPHLIDWRERIRINDAMVSINAVSELLQSIRPLAENLQATFFEVTTAIAFEVFRQTETTLNVIEVGLGGTWDCTNVVQPLVAHLTRIDLDHTEILGYTRVAIARDKSGIWKPCAAATSSRQVAAVERFLEKRFIDRKAKSYRNARSTVIVQAVRAKNTPEKNQIVRLVKLSEEAQREFAGLDHLELPLEGKHQRENLEGVLCVMLAVREQGLSQFTNDAIRSGLPKTIWRSRLEPLQRNPLIVADVAHNPAGAAALTQTLLARKPVLQGRYRLVIGLLADKDIAGVVGELQPLKPIIYAAPLTGERARDGRELAQLFTDCGCQASSFPTPEAALKAAISEANPNDCIVLTGSHYLVGSLLPRFQ